MTDVAAVVLAYHPDPSIVENTRALQTQVNRVYIVNNSSDSESGEVLRPFMDDASVRVLDQDGNVGVAAGFNAGMRAAIADGHDFVAIFDQDSTVTEEMIGKLVAAYEADPGRIGVVAPALRSQATGVVYRRESGSGVKASDVVISSGSLFSRSLVERIGMHDEPLFIDYVDHDICLRAQRYGLRNLKVYDAILDHRFGDSTATRLFGRQVYVSNYSTQRQYYMARNRLVIVRRFGLGRWFWEDLAYTAKAWTKVLLLESDRRAKVAAFLRGVRDGLRYPVR